MKFSVFFSIIIKKSSSSKQKRLLMLDIRPIKSEIRNMKHIFPGKQTIICGWSRVGLQKTIRVQTWINDQLSLSKRYSWTISQLDFLAAVQVKKSIEKNRSMSQMYQIWSKLYQKYNKSIRPISKSKLFVWYVNTVVCAVLSLVAVNGVYFFWIRTSELRFWKKKWKSQCGTDRSLQGYPYHQGFGQSFCIPYCLVILIQA